jgi:hypothetical protein
MYRGLEGRKSTQLESVVRLTWNFQRLKVEVPAVTPASFILISLTLAALRCILREALWWLEWELKTIYFSEKTTQLSTSLHTIRLRIKFWTKLYKCFQMKSKNWLENVSNTVSLESCIGYPGILRTLVLHHLIENRSHLCSINSDHQELQNLVRQWVADMSSFGLLPTK